MGNLFLEAIEEKLSADDFEFVKSQITNIPIHLDGKNIHVNITDECSIKVVSPNWKEREEAIKAHVKAVEVAVLKGGVYTKQEIKFLFNLEDKLL